MSKRTYEGREITTKLNILEKEDYINFTAVPSLSHISTVSIVTTLYKRSDITELMLRVIEFGSKDEKFLKQLRATACENISLLPLPKTLKDNVTRMVLPIANQMNSWLSELEKHTSRFIYNKCINHICWTMYGTIDTTKTIETIVKQDFCTIKNICDIYFISRHSCIPGFWCDNWKNMLSPDMKRAVYSDIHPGIGEKLKHWETFTQKRKKVMNDIIEKDFETPEMLDKAPSLICERMIRERNFEGWKYFWYKQTKEEKDQHLMNSLQMLKIDTSRPIRWRLRLQRQPQHQPPPQPQQDLPSLSNRIEGRIGIICFLLSQIKDGQEQKKVILEHVENLLDLLSHSFRFRILLIPTIKLIWDSLDKVRYRRLLWRLLKRVEKCDYTAEIFVNLWIENLPGTRNFFLRNASLGCLSENLPGLVNPRLNLLKVVETSDGGGRSKIAKELTLSEYLRVIKHFDRNTRTFSYHLI